MPKTNLSLLLVSMLLIVSQACAPRAPATSDPSTIDTAIAQTLAAAATQTADQGVPVTGPDTPTAIASPSPEPLTQTPTALVLPSPVFTPTAGTPQIRVVIPTNCRQGPGVAYARVGGLQPGQVAEIVGRHAERNYWIIREPNRNVVCWLWGEYATVTGDTDALPIYTPPPPPTSTPTPTATPAPSFTASYDGLESCTGVGWWVEFQLQNSGGIPFESLSVTVSDTTSDTVLSQVADSFLNRNGCNETDTRNDLPAGTSRIISSPVFTYDPSGRALRALITLCSGPGQTGACMTQDISFTP